MADRYWVGGSASWDGTAGTKWSTTDGGVGGASVPTSADDVFFTALSGANTVTIAAGNTGAKSVNCTGFTGTLAGTANISVSGSFTLSAGMTFTYSGTLTLARPGILTSAGKTFSGIVLIQTTQASSAISLGDAFISTNRIEFGLGTFNSANFNITATQLLINNSNGKSINLGSSTVTLTSTAPINFTITTNLTFNAGSSTIILTGAGTTIVSGSAGALGIVYNNISFTSTGSVTHSISGLNTFNNVSIVAPVSDGGLTQLTFNSNQVINGVLSTIGTAGNRRILIRSNTDSSTIDVLINSAPSITDVDFQDIRVIGSFVPINGTRIGDRRGNSGITFSAPKTVYWRSTSSSFWGADTWADSSGGSVSTNNYPLPQDTAIIDNTSRPSSIILGNTFFAMPSLDLSQATNPITLSINTTTNFYGDLKLGSGVTISGTNRINFIGRKTQTITSAGKTFTTPISINSVGGIVQLADAIVIDPTSVFLDLTVSNGEFKTNGYAVTCPRIATSVTNRYKKISLGASTVNVNNGGLDLSVAGTVFDAGTSTINFNTGNGGASINISQALLFHNVNINAGTQAGSTFDLRITLASGKTTQFNNFTIFSNENLSIIGVTLSGTLSTMKINGALTANGVSVVKRCAIREGDNQNIVIEANAISASNCDFEDIILTGAASGYFVTNGGDCGGNSGLSFPAPKTVYLNKGSTTFLNIDSAVWALSSGGSTSLNNFPLPQDTIIIDNNSTTNNFTLSNTSGRYNLGTLDSTGLTAYTLTFQVGSLGRLYGDLKISANSVLADSSSGPIFVGKTTQQLITNGVLFRSSIAVSKTSSILVLGDNLSMPSNRGISVSSGTFDANNKNITCGTFSCNSTGNRTVKMGSGIWTISGTGNCWEMISTSTITLIPGTAEIVLSDNSTTGRTFTTGNFYYHKLTIGGNTSNSTTTINGSATFGELASTKTVSHTIAFGANSCTIGKWSVTGTAGNIVNITGTSTQNTVIDSRVSGIDYLSFDASFGFNGFLSCEFYAGANSTGGDATVIKTVAPSPRTLYWIGGTGNWNDSTKWSLSSGGTSASTVPTSADSVVFDSLSNSTSYTVTINAVSRCANLTVSGPASGTITIGGTSDWLVTGDIAIASVGVSMTHTGSIYLSGTGTTKTIAAGVSLSSNIQIWGISTQLQLGSALTCNFFICLRGSFSTSSNNYSLSVGILDSSNFTSPRQLYLNASTITVRNGGGVFSINSRLLTFNAENANITFTAPGAITMSTGGFVYNNISYTSNFSVSPAISGGGTFNNITITRQTINSTVQTLTLDTNTVINGTLDFSPSTSPIRRYFVKSSIVGNPITLTVSNITNAVDVDFKDIVIAGTASPLSGTRLGNCGGNTNITFSAPKTVYFASTGTSNFSSAWSFTDAGVADNDAFPLAQDTAIFTANRPSSGSTITMDAWYNIGTLDMSARTTNTVTLTMNSVLPSLYGDFILGSGVTPSGNATITFSGTSTQNIVTSNKNIPYPIVINTSTGSVNLQDSLTTSAAITLTRGTFNTNNYNVTQASSAFTITSSTLNRSVNIGSSYWTIGSTGLSNGNSTNLSITGNGVLNFVGTGTKDFSGSSFGIYCPDLTVNVGAIGTLSFIGNNTLKSITSSHTGSATISIGATLLILTGEFSAKGSSGSQLIISATSAAGGTILYTGTQQFVTPSTVNYLNLTNITVLPTDKWYAGLNSTNTGSYGWIFDSGPVRNMKYGSINFSQIYYGSTPIKRVFYGSTLIWKE